MCDNSPVVYIEEVVIDNLFINCVLLAVAIGVMKEKIKWGRLILSAVLGTVFAVFLPFVDKAVIVYKLSALIVTTVFALRHKNLKKYILFVLIFATTSFAVGGVAYGLFNLSVGKNGALTYPAGKAVKYAVYGAIIFLLIVLRQIGRLAVRRRISASNEVKATVCIGENTFNVDCFDDTGNKLVDCISAKPVAVLSHDVGAHYVGGSVRSLEVGTVGGIKTLPLVTAEKLVISCGGKDKVYEKMPVVVADSDFEGYKLIVNLSAL